MLFILTILSVSITLASTEETMVTLTDDEKLQKIAKFKQSMESKTKLIADALEQQYEKKCSEELLSCTQKTYNLCEGTAKRDCLYNFPPLKGCLHPGIFLSKMSGVRVPNILQTSDLDDDVRKFICASAPIQNIFLGILENNEQEYSCAYIGSSSGALRLSPSFKQDSALDSKCVDFDPRIRPWYVSTITGPKNIIILFDLSKTMSSMFPGSRFWNAKITLKIILTTLNSHDNVAVVLFSKNARMMIFNQIVSATDANKNSLLSQILNLQSEDGATNYTAAIQLAVQVRNNFSASNCTSTFFLLLTDGYTQNDDTNSYEKIPDYMKNNLPGKILLISFVYGAKTNINFTFVEKVTYMYNGILFRMVDGIDEQTMIDKLTYFYHFLGQGFASRKAITWSDPYEDAFGFGKIMTAAIPIYSQNQLPRIIGVAGIDVFLAQLYAAGIDDTLIATQFKTQQQCYEGIKNNNSLSYLRCQAKGETGCAEQANIKQEDCFVNISMSVFYPEVQDPRSDSNLCCGITLAQFFQILFGSIGGFIFLVILIILIKKGFFKMIYTKFCKKQKVTINPETESDSSEERLVDPLNKYRDAQEDGILIYHEPQFIL